MVELLVASGADVNATDYRGLTTLSFMDVSGRQDIWSSKRRQAIISLLKEHNAVACEVKWGIVQPYEAGKGSPTGVSGQGQK